MPIRPSGRSLLVAPLALTLAACADEQGPANSLAPTQPPSQALSGLALPGATTGRYIVQFQRNAAPSIPAAALAASGGRVVGILPSVNGVVVTGVRNASALSATAGVLRLVSSKTLKLPPERPSIIPAALAANPSSATWFATGVQWDMVAMHAPAAWAISKQGDGAKVCILDTGIDGGHQEFAGKIDALASFVLNDPDDPSKGYSAAPLDSGAHGSHVAGSVTTNGIVLNGVAPKAHLLGGKVLDATGSGRWDYIPPAVAWCADQGADVINMSLGATAYLPGDAAFVSFLQDVMNYALNKGVVIVSSSGNDNLQLPNPIQLSVPAQLAGIVSVGATGPLSKTPVASPPNYNPFDPTKVWESPDTRAYYSNFGTGVTVFAPGGQLGTTLSRPYRYVNGVFQGSELDGVYSVCSSLATEWGGSPGTGSGPGPDQLCTGKTNYYAALQGTSMASPHVAGLAALLAAEIGGPRSVAKRDRIIQCIRKTTDVVGPASIYGGGRVNAERAIQYVHDGKC